MRQNKTLTFPFYTKIIPLFLVLFGIFCLFSFSEYIIYFSLLIIIFIPIFYLSFVKYIFENDKIKVKYPFFYLREYNIHNIIGYTFIYGGGEADFILFFDNGIKCEIKLRGKKMYKYIEEFINTINENMQNRNINDLKNKNIEFKIGRNKKILFNIEYLKYFIRDNENKYYYDNDIKYIVFQNYNRTIFSTIYLNNGKTIKFNDYVIKGQKGILKYLEERCGKSPNVI